MLAVIALRNLYRNFYSLPPRRCLPPHAWQRKNAEIKISNLHLKTELICCSNFTELRLRIMTNDFRFSFLCNRHSSSSTHQMSECCVSDGCRSSSSVLFFSEFFFAAAWSMKNCYCRDLCMHEQTVPLLFVRMDGCFRREMRGKCVKIVFPCRRVWTSWQNLARNEHTQHISSHPSQQYSSFGIN